MGRLRRLFSDNGNGIDWVKVLLALILLTMIATFISGYYLLFIQDNPPAVVYNATPVVDTASPGGFVAFDLDWCKYTKATAESVRADWVGSLEFTAPPQYPAARDNGCNIVRVLLRVPYTLPPDTYHVHVTRFYQVNPLAKRDITYEVGPFYIKEQ